MVLVSMVLVSLYSVCSPVWATSKLPTIVSTHLCADQLALSLAAPEQILSLSFKSQDHRRSGLAAMARIYPGNSGSSEEVIQLQPDIVLGSRRWRRHPQQSQFDALGIQVVVVPISNSWQQVFEHTQWLADQIGRSARGREIVADVRRRLTNLQYSHNETQVSQQSMLFLRPNGGSAGAGTYIDMLIEALGFINYASYLGLQGWGTLALETLVMQPPDQFLLSGYVRDNAFAKSQLSRHPIMKQLLQDRSRYVLAENQGNCANWQIIEAAEKLVGSGQQPSTGKAL